MKIIEQGTVKKEGAGYRVTGFIVDCEGGCLYIDEFLAVVGVPRDCAVQIEDLNTVNPVSMAKGIYLKPNKR